MKRLIISFFLIILVATFSVGCNNLSNQSKTNPNEPQRGDRIEYSKYLSLNEYETKSDKTGSSKAQSFKTSKESEWIVLSNENGKITIVASDNTLDNDSKGLGLNNQNAYLYGESVLNELCDKLYSTDYGKSRSLKVSDIYNLITTEKNKKSSANKNEVTFTSGTFFDGKEFKKATSANPIKVKSDYYYYDFYKAIDLSDIFSKDITTYRPADIYDNVKQYWLADSGVMVTNNEQYNMKYVDYGIHYSSGSVIYLMSTYKSDKDDSFVEKTYYLGVRPVVELKSNLKYTKTKKDNNTIWNIEN